MVKQGADGLEIFSPGEEAEGADNVFGQQLAETLAPRRLDRVRVRAVLAQRRFALVRPPAKLFESSMQVGHAAAELGADRGIAAALRTVAAREASAAALSARYRRLPLRTASALRS